MNTLQIKYLPTDIENIVIDYKNQLEETLCINCSEIIDDCECDKCDECNKEKMVGIDSLINNNHIEVQHCLSCSIKLNNIVEQRKKTCIEKYGVDNPMKVGKFVDKFKKNNINTVENQRTNIEYIRSD